MSGPPAETAARLAAIVASADDAIVSNDLTGIIRSWNPAAERLFGYTADEAVGQHIFLIVPENCHAQENAVLARLLDESDVDHYDTSRRRKDGEILQISVTVSPLRDASGRIVGVSNIARDITARKRMECDAMRLAAIVQSSDDAIVSKDLNGVILTWNHSAERMFGYTASEAIGQSIRMIIPEDRLHEEAEVLRRIRAGILVDHFETIRRRKDGREVEISLTVSPIRDANGTVIGASKIARDIGEQRRLRAMADEASRLKDEFLAVLSHELRTPLNTVLGYARMLRQPQVSMDDEKRERALVVLERNAATLAKLVDDVLDTSRSMAGKLRLAIERVNLEQIVRDALETMSPAAEAKNITLQLDIESRLETPADPDRLGQVVLNLVSNAVKFTPLGGTVSVRVFRDGPESVIEVRDTGVGIAPDHLPCVFQRFWQAESGASREHGGLGLGLALVRHLVELHGGSVAATSAGKGQGATFTVRLPPRAPRNDVPAPPT
jgi:PAS domain S-box-containing protein